MTIESLDAESRHRSEHVQTIAHVLNRLRHTRDVVNDLISLAHEAASEIRTLRMLLQNKLEELDPPRPPQP